MLMLSRAEGLWCCGGSTLPAPSEGPGALEIQDQGPPSACWVTVCISSQVIGMFAQVWEAGPGFGLESGAQTLLLFLPSQLAWLWASYLTFLSPGPSTWMSMTVQAPDSSASVLTPQNLRRGNVFLIGLVPLDLNLCEAICSLCST